MRAEWYPESIRLTSDALGHDGFRVVLRDLPDDGEEGSAQRGTSHFHFGYRPFQEKGRTIFLFHEAPEQPVLTNRIASLFPPDKAFLCSWQGAGGRIATFEVHPRFFEEVLRRAAIPAGGFGSLPPARFAINRQVDALCQLLMWETEKGGSRDRLYFESLATALLLAVTSQSDPRLPDAGNLEAQQRRIQRAIALMEANFRSNVTLEQVARAACLSAFHFHRLFHRVMGLTPHQYLLRCRLHHAQQLLTVAGEKHSLADVAMESGFADQAHFSRHFRRAYGVSPLEFQRAQE
jgi:AraC-like DNA-binding protein